MKGYLVFEYFNCQYIRKMQKEKLRSLIINEVNFSDQNLSRYLTGAFKSKQLGLTNWLYLVYTNSHPDHLSVDYVNVFHNMND